MTEKAFAGFPARARLTPLPNLFFSAVLPQIDDLAELKLTLHVFWVLYQKRGYPRFVTYRELLGDKTLIAGLAVGAPQEALRPSWEGLRRGLDRAVGRGILLRLDLDRDGKREELYFLNTEADRRAVARIESGELSLGALPHGEAAPPTIERPNIFSLYEQNIGLLTPMLSEELREAEKLYPASWIEDAFKEAVSLNRRNWRYIARILERWAQEGKDHGKPGRDHKENFDSDKYLKGRYGHVVRG